MATIELAHLSDHLDSEQISLATKAFQAEVDEAIDLNSDEDTQILDSSIDDDIFVDFRDRLEANDLDADIYVPIEFEETLTIGEVRFGSTYALQLVLESLREDFFVEDEDGDIEVDETDDDFEREAEEDDGDSYDGDDDAGTEMKDELLRSVWRMLYKGAEASIEANLPLFLLA